MKKLISILVRCLMILLAVSALAMTIWRCQADVIGQFASSEKSLLLIVFFLYGLMQLFGAWRWRELQRVLGQEFSLFEALRLTLLGNFFSVFIPGAVSGDVLKIAFASVRYPKRKTELTLATLMDRVLGLSGLFVTASVMIAICASQLLEICRDNCYMAIAVCGILASSISIIVLLLVLPLLPMKSATVENDGEEFRKKLLERIFAVLRRLKDGILLYRTSPGSLFACLGLSAIIHFICGLMLFLIGRALFVTGLSFFQFNLVMQFSNAASIIPVFPGGIGLRDLVASELMTIFTGSIAPENGSTPVFYTFVIIIWGIIGAIFWMVKRTENESIIQKEKSN